MSLLWKWEQCLWAEKQIGNNSINSIDWDTHQAYFVLIFWNHIEDSIMDSNFWYNDVTKRTLSVAFLIFLCRPTASLAYCMHKCTLPERLHVATVQKTLCHSVKMVLEVTLMTRAFVHKQSIHMQTHPTLVKWMDVRCPINLEVNVVHTLRFTRGRSRGNYFQAYRADPAWEKGDVDKYSKHIHREA